MHPYCLRLDFDLNLTPHQWLSHCRDAVPTMRDLPGLSWKLWLLDPRRRSAGGVYCFESEAAARRYAEGPTVAAIRSSGAVSGLEVSLMPVVADLSSETRALSIASPR